MAQKFTELSDLIYEIATKISDIEYKNIMDKMTEIHNIYIKNKDKDKDEDECDCIEYQLCTSSIQDSELSLVNISVLKYDIP